MGIHGCAAHSQGVRDRVTELNCTQDVASEAEAEMEAIAFVKNHR
jgi:hypothetical protein